MEAAAATSGRAVVMSGPTVMVAMAGMYLDRLRDLYLAGHRDRVVVAVSVVGSVSVLPAMLAWLGDRIDQGPGAIRRAPRARRRGAHGRAMVNRSCGVRSRPWCSACRPCCSAPALPALSPADGGPGMPRVAAPSLPSQRRYDRLQAGLPRGERCAEVVVPARDVTAPAVQRAIAPARSWAPSVPGSSTTRSSVEVSRDRSHGDGVSPAGRPRHRPAARIERWTKLRDRPPARGTIGKCGARGERRWRGRRILDFTEPRSSRVRRWSSRSFSAGLPAAYGHLPLDGDPAEGDRSEPAVGGRRLRRARDPVPGRPAASPLRLPRRLALSPPGCRCSCS